MSVYVVYHYSCPDGVFGALAAHLHFAAKAIPVQWVPLQVFRPEAERIATLKSLLAPADTLYVIDFTGGPVRDACICVVVCICFVFACAGLHFCDELPMRVCPIGAPILWYRCFTTSNSMRALNHSIIPRMTLPCIWRARDFSSKQAFIEACCAACARVVVLDHHQTGQTDLAAPVLAALPNLETHFDMSRSGATMARDHFDLRGLLAGRADNLLRVFDYIEDHDLFRHALPDSQAFTAGLADLRLEYDPNKNDTLFDRLQAIDVSATINRGREVLAAEQQVISAELQTAFRLKIVAAGQSNPLTVLAVATAHPGLRSELGSKLSELSAKAGLAAAGVVIYEEASLGADVWKVSLRSDGVTVDTTPWSKAFGGGGHAGASSFNIAKTVFDTWRV
jgi:hypothetical protein